LLTLASVYNNSRILSEFISSQLEKDKNHRRLLRRIILSIEKFWASYNFGFNGIQLRVTGKLNGRMRKSKYQYILGKVSLQTLQTVISYTMTVAYTKFGLISTKLWLFYGIKKI
jgi:small subunit ribosomal protein S3